MTNDEFETIFKSQMDICRNVLVEKAKEYATDDRLHNFKVAAEMQGCTNQAALGGMMAKHTVSIYDMIESDYMFSWDQWNEKITDHINYLILLRATVFEEYNNVKATPVHDPQNYAGPHNFQHTVFPEDPGIRSI